MNKLPFVLFTVMAWGSGVAYAHEPADSLKDVRPFANHALELIHEPGVEVISSMGAPGMTPTIFVHGVPVHSGMESLYIVDGIRVRSLNGIAPESVEKIEVLKDASAMGLYGPEAVCGVVVVTTRRASQKGFHAGYSFTGGFQSLAHEPRKLNLKDWLTFWNTTEDTYSESDQPVPESAFVHDHHLYTQYGGKNWSAYADFSALSNDGPYPGRVDTHNRHAASWSANYRPLKWLSLETTGHWSRSYINQAHDGWLTDYLLSRPIYRDSHYAYLYSDRSGFSESFVQGKLEIRPLRGLYLRGIGGYSNINKNKYHVTWQYAPGESYERVTFNTSENGYKLTQWGVEAGWSGQRKGHRLNIDARFRRVNEDSREEFLNANPDVASLGLSRKDIDDLDNKVKIPCFEEWFEPSSESLFDWIEMTSKYGMRSARHPSDKTNMHWKETVLSTGYDWEKRYEAGYSFFELWEDKMFEDNAFRVHAVTLGWNPSKEPLVRHALPKWWKDWSIKASWAKSGESISLMNASAFINIFGTIIDYTKTLHRGLTSSATFQFGKTSLELSASWYINKENLYELDQTVWYVSEWGSEFKPVEREIKEEWMYSIRNRGVDASVSLKGNLGQVRYSIISDLAFYRNKVSTPANVYYELWGTNDSYQNVSDKSYTAVYLRDGESIGGRYLYTVQNGKYCTYDDREWLGRLYPSVTGSIRLSAGWQRWQLTVAGHGDWGHTIIHNADLDALTGHYMANLRTEANPNGYYYVDYYQNYPKNLIRAMDETEYAVHSGSFFRIDQIRLDYTLPVKNVNIDIFASLENWFLFTKYPGSDPELALALKKMGTESATYPSTRRTLFGLSVNF